jgi:hypothetical protein
MITWSPHFNIQLSTSFSTTQEFMASEGIELNSPEEIVKDPYTENRKQPPRSYITPSDFDKLRQFLVMDRKVLRFYCVWDDRDAMFGEMRPFVSWSFPTA